MTCPFSMPRCFRSQLNFRISLAVALCAVAVTIVVSAGAIAPAPVQMGAEAPRYQNYAPPAGLGGSAGEPSIGVNPMTGKVFFVANTETLRVSFDDCASPAKTLWEDVTPPDSAGVTLDPILFTDQRTRRTFTSQLLGKASEVFYTDNDGQTWQRSQGSGINSGVDHQTIGGGPFVAPLTGVGYQNATYYCSQDAAVAQCALSLDGGRTYGPAVPIYNITQCAGIHGHVKVAPDGTVYVPNKSCGNQQGVAVSGDNGVTWAIRTIPDSVFVLGIIDPSLGIGADNTLYFAYRQGGAEPGLGRAMVSVSRNKGVNWSPSVNVGAAFNLNNVTFPEAVAGDGDRAAVAFVGTPTDGNYQAPPRIDHDGNPTTPPIINPNGFKGEWHMYIAHTYDRGATWTMTDATPTDPVQRNSVCNSGTTCTNTPNDRNLLDFNDMTVDAQGRALVGYSDGCITARCIQGLDGDADGFKDNDYSARAAISRQSGGRPLYAQFDPNPPGPTVPKAPRVDSVSLDQALNARLSWSEPDNGGSPITGYNVSRKTGATGTFAIIATVTTRTYEDLTLEPNTTYFYKVTAFNSIGEGTNCGEFTPVVIPQPDPCTLPGVQVLSDPTGDGVVGVPAQAFHDIQRVSVAEPFALGTDKLAFIIKVRDLSTVPPATTYPLQFDVPTTPASRYLVQMRVVTPGPAATAQVAFEYRRNLPAPATAFVPADPLSNFNPNGTITIVVPRSGLGNPAAGQNLTGFLLRVTEGAVTPDNAPDDLAPAGSYTIVSNFFCRPNTNPLAALSATPSSGPAPLMVNFDASGSSDPDAGDTIAEYELSFGDGSPVAVQSTPTFTHTYNAPGTYRARLTVTDSRGLPNLNVADAFITVSPAAAGLQYYPLSRPLRLLDTRSGQPACDTPGAPLTGGADRFAQARVTCDGQTIPANAQVLVGNATAVNDTGAAAGFVTLYPSEENRPVVSNLNYSAGQVVPNAFTTGLSSDGGFNIYASTGINFVLDVTGYYAPPAPTGLYYHALPRPLRLLDTRSGQPACDAPGQTLTAGQARAEGARITCNGITIPPSARAIVGNATVVNDTGGSAPPGGISFVTLYPTGVARPTASNLNYTAGQIVPNAFTTALGNDGAFNIYATESINFVVDVTGYYSDQATDTNGAGLFYFSLPMPLRLLDTRAGQPACEAPGAPLTGGVERTQNARVTCQNITVPASALAIVGNATVVNDTGSVDGFVTLYPSGVARPTASNLNYVQGQTVPNMFTVGLGADGAFNIYPTTPINFIVDVAGFFAP